MGYNRESFVKIKKYFEDKNETARKTADANTEKLHALIPETAEIDKKITSLGMELILGASKYHGERYEEYINEKKAATDVLVKKRADLLIKNGFEPDFDEPKFDCKKCQDTGFDGLNMCDCMKKALNLECVRTSGIGALADKCTFDNYDLSYYLSDGNTLENNMNCLEYLKIYADSFSLQSPNLLIMGGTGLGKTHLSVAVAKTVIEKGYDVVFAISNDLISDFEYDKFRRSNSDTEKSAKYTDCDLLIIDDFGAEFSNGFTVPVFYNLINTRLNSGKPTIISTNLSPEKVRSTYDDRVYSRLFGQFNIFTLMGKDARLSTIENKED